MGALIALDVEDSSGLGVAADSADHAWLSTRLSLSNGSKDAVKYRGPIRCVDDVGGDTSMAR